MKESLVDLLLLVAYADGTLHAAEEKLLLQAVRIFQLESHYGQIKSRFTGSNNDLSRCFQILGCKPTDELKAIKAKYRKLAMEYHPDRVLANGMSPELASGGGGKVQGNSECLRRARKAQAPGQLGR